MADNKNNQNTDSQTLMGDKSDREFENKKQNLPSGQDGKSPQAAGNEKEKRTKGEKDDDMTTAGGREGQFSDKDRGKEGQWSPSSSRSADE